MLFAFNCISLAKPLAYGSSAESAVKDEPYIERKFEPRLWKEIQALKSNGTMRDFSLIIRLKTDQRVTGMHIRDLKNYAASLFTSNHNATVYSVLSALPIVMAKVPVAEAEEIASCEFVESIGDGDRRGSLGLDVSRSAIRASDVKTALGFDGWEKKIAILDSGIDINHPDRPRQ